MMPIAPDWQPDAPDAVIEPLPTAARLMTACADCLR